LKINYHKSEAYAFGMEQGEQRRIANMPNCRMGEIPMKYLGLPIRDIKLGREDFVELPEKIAKRIPHGRGSTHPQGAG
jgi:hypothetical protein